MGTRSHRDGSYGPRRRRPFTGCSRPQRLDTELGTPLALRKSVPKKILPFPAGEPARLICTFLVSLSDWVVVATKPEPGYTPSALAHATVGQPLNLMDSSSDARCVLQLASSGYPQRIPYTTTLDGVCYEREMRCAREGDVIVVKHYHLSDRPAS